jgi:hypothetical protein
LDWRLSRRRIHTLFASFFELNKLVFWNLEALQSVVQFVAPVGVGHDRVGTVDDDVHERQAEGFGSDALLPLGVVFSPKRADVRVFNLLHYAFASRCWSQAVRSALPIEIMHGSQQQAGSVGKITITIGRLRGRGEWLPGIKKLPEPEEAKNRVCKFEDTAAALLSVDDKPTVPLLNRIVDRKEKLCPIARKLCPVFFVLITSTMAQESHPFTLELYP